MKYKIHITILIAFNLSCGILFDPLKEELNNNKGDKIALKDAVKIVKESMLGLSTRCPAFLSSKYNWISGYFAEVLVNDCVNSYDPIKGCGDKNYLSRSQVQLCSLVMQNDPCLSDISDSTQKETRFSSSFAVTYAVCASAFKKSPINLLFF
jgi:hypothetical protein